MVNPNSLTPGAPRSLNPPLSSLLVFGWKSYNWTHESMWELNTNYRELVTLTIGNFEQKNIFRVSIRCFRDMPYYHFHVWYVHHLYPVLIQLVVCSFGAANREGPTKNCQLTDWPPTEIDPRIHLTPGAGFELYERGSFGHGCENDQPSLGAHGSMQKHTDKRKSEKNDACVIKLFFWVK